MQVVEAGRATGTAPSASPPTLPTGETKTNQQEGEAGSRQIGGHCAVCGACISPLQRASPPSLLAVGGNACL